MSKSSNQAWKTKYGARRVRDEAPTLPEAIFAAQGLSDDIEAQAEIAAALMGLPLDQVRAAVLKTAPLPKEIASPVAFAGPASAPRAVIVERKPSRRIPSAALSAAAASVRTERPAFGERTATRAWR